jgi:lysophospholipase L1-like esterase
MQLRDNFGRMGSGLGKLLAEQGPFDLVIIMAGTNDVAMPQYSVEEVLASLKKMHKACWATGTPTIALSVPESSVTGTPQFPEAQRKWHVVNNALAAWAKAEQGNNQFKGLVNSARLLAFDHTARMRGLWDPDSLHFSAAGSREFGSKLAPVVASHLQEKTRLPQVLESVVESDDLSPEPESPTKKRRLSMLRNQTMTADSEGPRTLTRITTPDSEGLHRAPLSARAALTPERVNGAVVRNDRATSAGQNCGIQNLRTMPVRAAGVPSAPIMHRPMQQLRVGRVH